MLWELIVSIIRPILEYAAVVWSPHLKKHVVNFATRMIPELGDISYMERLEKLRLPLYRREKLGVT